MEKKQTQRVMKEAWERLERGSPPSHRGIIVKKGTRLFLGTPHHEKKISMLYRRISLAKELLILY